jgi:hypothetical protein
VFREGADAQCERVRLHSFKATQVEVSGYALWSTVR